jgi:hypothetical protein
LIPYDGKIERLRIEEPSIDPGPLFKGLKKAKAS